MFLALAIIGLVLLQRSEGGGLGIGGGNAGGLTTTQGAANFMTRATGICAAAFFCTSLILGILAGQRGKQTKSIIDEVAKEAKPAIQAPVEEKQIEPTVPIAE